MYACVLSYRSVLSWLAEDVEKLSEKLLKVRTFRANM
eukprot:COSAG02_NODE_14839_length_1231_cov_0.891343_1_plen_36_part_10